MGRKNPSKGISGDMTNGLPCCDLAFGTNFSGGHDFEASLAHVPISDRHQEVRFSSTLVINLRNSVQLNPSIDAAKPGSR